MESYTKTTFSQETITHLVQSQFGTHTHIQEIVPLTAGYFNTAYAIHFTDRQPDVVLRIAPHADQPVLTYEKELMRREVLILKTVQAYEDILTPKMLGYDLSRSLIDRDYMFVEKLSGIALQDVKEQLTPDNVQEIERQVGQFAARLAEIKGDSFGYFGDGIAHGSRTWRQAFSAIMETLFSDGESLGVVLPIPYANLRAILQQQAASLEEITRPCFVHWDLWAGNVFIKPDNGRYTFEGIIDWERALWGDPDFETAVACRFYGPAFYQGYGKSLAERGPEAARQSLYRLFLWLVLLIEAKVRYEDAAHLPWAREQLLKELDFIHRL